MFKNKIFRYLGILMLILLITFAFKDKILVTAGSFLIKTNEFEYVEYAFVLSGQALERGSKAAQLYNKGKIGQIICTGANQPPDLAVYESTLLESDLTVMQILKVANDSFVTVSSLKVGTSTKEESDAILLYSKENGLDTILVISSLFHTKRIYKTFYKKFKKEGIEVLIAGAPSNMYNEKLWWKSEYGLIALNNEYIKLIYYFLKGY